MLSGAGGGRAPVVSPVRSRPGSRIWVLDFYSSAVGKKAVMAVTGMVLLSFVLLHMAGNLKIYDSAAHMNEYGEYLRTIGEPILPHTGFLWILRSGLIIAFILHIHAAYSLTVINRRARPRAYQGGLDYIAANYAARMMRWSGVIVGLFLIYHLMDLTWGIGLTRDDFERGQPYQNMVNSLEFWPIAVVYIVANLALGLHIFHGAWSMFQSLGWNHPRFNRWRNSFAIAFAAVIVAGNVSFPIAIMTGIVE
jgi:succinate dehydrogenase / fumarate reductase cytochrome b subunit